MGRQKKSSGGGAAILFMAAAGVFLAPAICVIALFGIGPAHKSAVEIALNSPAAWVGSGLFWVFLYIGYHAIRGSENAGSIQASMASQRQEAEEHIRQLVRGEFPNTSLLLIKGEKAYFVEDRVRLYETRASRLGTGLGTRVGRLYIGKSESHYVDKLAEIDTGDFVITNERVCFSGRTEQRTIELKDIQDIETYPDHVSIASKKRGKKMLFAMSNPTLCQVIIRNILNGRFENTFKEGLKDYDGSMILPPSASGQPRNPSASVPKASNSIQALELTAKSNGKGSLRDYDEFLKQVAEKVRASLPIQLAGVKTTIGHWQREQNRRFHWKGTNIHVGVNIERTASEDIISVYFCNYKKDERVSAILSENEATIRNALALRDDEINLGDVKDPITQSLGLISPETSSSLVASSAERVIRFLQVLKPALGDLL